VCTDLYTEQRSKTKNCWQKFLYKVVITVIKTLLYTLRLFLSDYKQAIKNLVFFLRQMVLTMEDEVMQLCSLFCYVPFIS
jgi:signal transduction histidine kinase